MITSFYLNGKTHFHPLVGYAPEVLFYGKGNLVWLHDEMKLYLHMDALWEIPRHNVLSKTPQ